MAISVVDSHPYSGNPGRVLFASDRPKFGQFDNCGESGNFANSHRYFELSAYEREEIDDNADNNNHSPNEPRAPVAAESAPEIADGLGNSGHITPPLASFRLEIGISNV